MRAHIEPQNKIQLTSMMPVFVRQFTSEQINEINLAKSIADLNVTNNMNNDIMTKTVANSDILFDAQELMKKKVAFTNEVVKDDIRAIVTDDKDLKDQYYRMRHESYRGEYGFDEYDGSECEYDLKGDVIVVVNDNGEVLGGCRLMCGEVGKGLLSNEIIGTEFTYLNLFKKTNGGDLVGLYSEISNLVVKMGYRDTRITQKLVELSFEKASNFGCKYLFGIAPVTYCRNYRKICTMLNCESEVIKDFIWHNPKKYKNMRMCPIITNVSFFKKSEL